MEKVSYTAQWTAAARALESERGAAARFQDGHARLLAGEKGFELLNRYKGTAVADYVALRTQFVDDAIVDLQQRHGVKQVVLVASGLDTRAYRLQWAADTVLYEVDHVDLFAYKNQQLRPYAAQRAIKAVDVGVDLATDWIPALLAAGYDPKAPTLWVAEGLFFFLTEEQASTLLQVLAASSTRDSWLITDFVSQATLRHPLTQAFLRTLEADGTPWRFGTDEPEAFLNANRWQPERVAQPGEGGAGEEYWRYPVVARDVRGVPRNWLVTARHG